MRNLDLQQVVVYENRRLRLAHVAINNMYMKNGWRNSSASLSGCYNQAKYAMRGAADNPSTENAFGSSFVTRLMNTGMAGWEEIARVENLTVDQALKCAASIRHDLEDRAYDVTGLERAKGIRHTGKRGLTNFIIKNATQKKIFEIVERLMVGMENVSLFKAQKAIYREYNRDTLQTRRQFWNYINENKEVFAA